MEPLEVLVQADSHDRIACPVWVQLPLTEGGLPSVRVTDESGRAVPCQLEPSGIGTEDRLWLTWIVRDLAGGQERRYRIEPASAGADGGRQTAGGGAAGGTTSGETSARPEAGSTPAGATDHGLGVVLAEGDGQLTIDIAGQRFTTYFFGAEVVRPYFHPLFGPTGQPVTRQFPMVKDVPGETSDHPHHKGFYVAHGDVNGTDNWSEGPNHATMRHAGFQRLVSGPVYGSFDATTEWMDRDGTRVVLAETRRCTFFNLGADDRLFDVSLRFNAVSGLVTFGDTKEGGLISVRMASAMDEPHRRRPDGTGRIENSYGGVGEKETWGKRAMWCDYSGQVEGEPVGICLMDHPTNPRYPTHWHVRSYGLMTANPFGLHDFYSDTDAHRGDWTIPAYESRNFLYRVLVHRGGTAQSRVRDRYHDFVNPPAIQLMP